MSGARFNTLKHVKKALELTHTGKRDLVVMTVHLHQGAYSGYKDIAERDVFTSYEQLLFSKVVTLAEKSGKHVDLLVVPSSEVFSAIAQTAAQLHSAEIIAGSSSVMTPAEQARRMGIAWERLVKRSHHRVVFRVVEPNGAVHDFLLGAHAPELSMEEIHLIHKLWLEMAAEPGGENLHHKDVVTIALARLEQELKGENRKNAFEEMRLFTGEPQSGEKVKVRQEV